MSNISYNIISIRKSRGENQSEFSNFLGIKRTRLGSYEEGRAEPGIEMIIKISSISGISIDNLLTTKVQLSNVNHSILKTIDSKNIVYLNLISNLHVELVKELIITPVQKSQIENYINSKFNK